MANLTEVFQEPQFMLEFKSVNKYYNSQLNNVTKNNGKNNLYGLDRAENYGPKDIKLVTELGTPITTYRNSIIRPFDSTYLPTDIKRTTGIEECKSPAYAGSKFQQWCSPKNATNYHAMRPIIEPNQYNNLLRKLFNQILINNTGKSMEQLPINNSEIWSAVFCEMTNNQLSNFLSVEVSKAVNVIPEMDHNGPYGREQFHIIDTTIYQYIQENKIYYKVLFSLYNALRSVSSMVYATIFRDRDLKIIQMSFVNNEEYSQTEIKGFNSGIAGSNKQIDINTGPVPTDINWNYGNTLLKQEFNQHGFYNEDTNIPVKASISDSLKKKIRKFEQESDSYLMPSTSMGFSGTIRDKNYEYNERLIQKPSSYANSMDTNPNVIYDQNILNITPTKLIYH